jgi:hypothetical protein
MFLGTSAFQNPVWLAIFAAVGPSMLGGRRTAAIYLLVFWIFCPAAMQDFVTGGDYLINAIYVAIAVHWLVSMRSDWPWTRRLPAFLFFALCLSSRAIYGVEVPILAAFIWRRRGATALLEFLLATGAALIAINAPFFFSDPARYPLFFALDRLAYFPPQLHAELVIPAISLGIACSAWVVRLSPRRVFLISALSFIPMFIPGLLFLILTHGPTRDVLLTAGYSLPLTVFGGLWLLHPISQARVAGAETSVAEVQLAAQAG